MAGYVQRGNRRPRLISNAAARNTVRGRGNVKGSGQNGRNSGRRGRRFSNLQLILFIALMAIIVVTAVVFVLDRSMFVVKYIQIEGLSRISPEHARDLSGVMADTKLFDIDFGAVTQNLEKSPYLKVVLLKRKLPDTIRIVLKERVPCASIEVAETYVMLDVDGMLLEAVNGIPDVGPVLRGLTVDNPMPGNIIASSEEIYARRALLIVQALEANAITREISVVELQDLNNVIMRTDYGIVVEFGQAIEIDKKVFWLKDMLPKLKEEGKQGTLNLDTVENKAKFTPNLQE